MAAFGERIAQLHALVASGHGAHVPQSTEHAGLGVWLAQQREAHRNGSLMPERVANLRAVPGLRGFE
jgi:hypothetical protein